MTKVELVCGLVGDVRSVFVVEIDKEKRVGTLIARTKGICGIGADVDLHIFSTQSNGWLKAADVAAYLEKGTINDSMGAVLKSGKLGEWVPIERAFDGMPTLDVIHALVVLIKRSVDDDIDDRPLKRGVWRDVDMAPLEFIGDMVRLSSTFLEGSGLEPPLGRKDLVLFRREAVDNIWGEIQRSAINLTASVVATGSPGSGKSVASYAFAGGLIDLAQWNVLWIRITHKDSHYSIVQFCYGKKLVSAIPLLSMPYVITALLASFDSRGKTSIVFFDGYAKDVKHKVDEVFIRCRTWRDEDRTQRRLVVVSSIAASFEQVFEGTKPEEDDSPRLLLDLDSVSGVTGLKTKTHGEVARWTMATKCDDVLDVMIF
ncbi:hypothetical protein Poli38472_007617 [Pythium oligandrum]|uniref:Crinkler effector protein N-terminal domain-containing protein n=1 Tax=Pythium oligandrum TaxID=41045 RepID=A0A8K1CR05_PYTOL|nr:hypothetical protein Poli38472_007617 [Pythium oligandrum]|eukprot:TMW67945.1 hypothetical protein Poli38472_007617 [Pythium oligandrum]